MSVMQIGKWARGVALPPDWWVPKADGRTLDLDFGAGAYWDNAAGAQGIGAAASFDRNSAAGRFGPAGNYEAAAADVLRRDFNPATLAARGALIEPAVAYAGVNSLHTGAVAGVVGSGGAKPDGMVVGRPSGLTEEVFLGATGGIPWVELRISGTASSTAAITIFLNASTGTAALAGQTWRHALYCAVTGDDAAVNALNLQVSERNSGGSFVAATGATSIYSVRSTWDRRSISALLTGGTTANAQQQIATNSVSSGATIDWRIRIGGATFTQTAYLPSVYLVGTSAATRLADTLTIPAGGSWFNAAAGTILLDIDPDYAANAVYLGLPGAANTFDDTLYVTAASASTMALVIRVGAASVANISRTVTFGAPLKAALSWSASRARFVTTGQTVSTDASVGLPGLTGEVRFGRHGWSTTGPTVPQHHRRLTYWPHDDFDDTALGALVA